ncbi:MAG: hypothetical protein JXP73_17130 [Deltaproteobacteria bacterium]|nr:hypothetical protein [Deltaproteobacteria bacterium]
MQSVSSTAWMAVSPNTFASPQLVKLGGVVILNPATGKGLILAIDHGMALGPVTGIADAATTIKRLMKTGRIDAWLIAKGILTNCFEPDGEAGIILRASGAATIAGPALVTKANNKGVRILDS